MAQEFAGVSVAADWLKSLHEFTERGCGFGVGPCNATNSSEKRLRPPEITGSAQAARRLRVKNVKCVNYVNDSHLAANWPSWQYSIFT